MHIVRMTSHFPLHVQREMVFDIILVHEYNIFEMLLHLSV